MNAWERWFWLWQVFFAADFVVTIGLVLLEEGSAAEKAVSAGAMVAIAAVYVTFGRRDYERWGGIVFAAVVVALAAVAIFASTVAGFVLFFVCPMLYMFTPLAVAVPLAVVAVLVPVLALVVREGLDAPAMTTLVPMSAMLIVFSLCVGLWVERVLRESRERAELIEQLEASRAEISRLSHEAGTSAERERLAREIHDTLAQGFTSILTLLQAVDSEWEDHAAVRRHVRLATRTARDNLAEARAMVAALTPSALAAGTLEDALRRQVDRLAEETPIAARFEAGGGVPALRTATEVVLLRAAQEALTNVRKHARASSAVLELSVVDGRVRLTVCDDGRGFDPEVATEGFGLKGMRARAEQVGGSLSVQSRQPGGQRSGQGTTVTVEVPA